MGLEDVPEHWERWSDEQTKIVLAYRPDIFDSSDLPAACLPTIYVTKGRRDRRPGRRDPGPDARWRVTLYLEPAVDTGTAEYESREGAVSGATALARRFDAGDIDYREPYEVPRPPYFERLDAVTGRET